jgi:transposase
MTYNKTFKEEAIKLSNEIGTRKAAEQLGIPYYTLAEWRKKRSRYGEQANIGSGNHRVDPQKQREMELEKENQELRRSNEILKEALAFFVKDRKK